MKRWATVFLVAMMAVWMSGCGTMHRGVSRGMPAAMAREAETPDVNRMLIWRASLWLEVDSVSNAASRVVGVAEDVGGYVESESASGDASARITLRVPVDSLKPAMAALESVGKVTDRRVSSQDVTEQYIDTDARLKTKIALRDRLQALLDKADTVQDVLAIEKELSRVQADIDSMQARLKALKGKVDLATIEVSMKRKRILGPIGYALKGAWWAVEKLFVIKE